MAASGTPPDGPEVPELGVAAAQQRLLKELRAMRRLHDLNAKLLAAPDLGEALREILTAATEMLGARQGHIQLLNRATGKLELVAQLGFDEAFIRRFGVIAVGDGTACSRALERGYRAIFEDIHAEPAYRPYLDLATAAGYRAVQATPLRALRGQIVGVISTHFAEPHRPSEDELRMLDLYARLAADLLERILGENALRDSEEKFRALAEASPALIWVVDERGATIYVNPCAAQLTGRSEQSLLGDGWLDLVHPADLASFTAALRAAQQSRGRLKTRLRIKNRYGHWAWLESHSLPLFAAGGIYRGHVGISLDVSESVAAEQALIEADRLKDEFLATLAHELRNPLAPIRNALRLLKTARTPQAVEKVRETLDRQVGTMIRLVDDLMEISRITRGKIALRRARVEVADIVRGSLEASMPLIEAGGQELTVNLPDEPLVLDADPVRIGQILTNLLNNSAKYTPAHGRIGLQATRAGDQAVIAVRDNGVGIAPDMLPHVFDMFTQANSTAGLAQGGLGIGLALARELASLHGGTLSAHSEGLGQGAEFVLRLPLAVDEGATRTDAAQDVAPQLDRVLVVDDNRDGADSLGDLLRELGWDTRVVYGGAQALEAVEAFRPAIVLLDLGMPDMDGLAVARRIRGDPRFGAMRLLALSGWGQAADRQRSREEGFDGHLVKPVDIDMLDDVLRTHCQALRSNQ